MRPRMLFGAMLLVAAGCRGTPAKSSPVAEGVTPAPAPTAGRGVPVPQRELALLHQLQDEVSAEPGALTSRYPVRAENKLGYNPLRAQHMNLIQQSSFLLDEPEREILKQNGFVISGNRDFPSYTYGYIQIYAADLPVFISADSILDAVHRAYDDILADLETNVLSNQLEALLKGLRLNLSQSEHDEASDDLAKYLEVADALMAARGNDSVSPEAAKLLDVVRAAEGTAEVTLFGEQWSIDASQFKPRGHYDRGPRLQAYFRASMWLGRTVLMLVSTKDQQAHLHRRSLAAALKLHGLLDLELADRARVIEETLRLFVGESDSMTFLQIPELLRALHVDTAQAALKLDDAALVDGLMASGLGRERILSRIAEEQRPRLDISFGLFGQRFAVDSHVLSAVSYDRTSVKRMMPDPLDVAFAALANDHALPLLEPGMRAKPYANELGRVRKLIDGHDSAFGTRACTMTG